MRLAVVHPFWRHPVKQLRSPKHRALITHLVRARYAAELTQRALAAKLGRSYTFVWKFEAGERRLDVLEFIEIAQILGVRASDLIAKIETGAGAAEGLSTRPTPRPLPTPGTRPTSRPRARAPRP